MKIEIKLNEYGDCDYFKIDGKEYGQGIYKVNILLNGSNSKIDTYVNTKFFKDKELHNKKFVNIIEK